LSYPLPEKTMSQVCRSH